MYDIRCNKILYHNVLLSNPSRNVYDIRPIKVSYHNVFLSNPSKDVYDIRLNKVSYRDVFLSNPSRDVYVTSVVWKDQDNVMVVWLNRPQNTTITTICKAFSADCQTVSLASYKAFSTDCREVSLLYVKLSLMTAKQ